MIGSFPFAVRRLLIFEVQDPYCWNCLFIKEFILCRQLGSGKAQGKSPSACGNKPVAWWPPPDLLEERLFQRLRPERFLYIRVPALSMTRPLGVLCQL